MARLYHYMDGSGALIEVEEVVIPGIGLGLAVHTTSREPALPLDEIPRLISALHGALYAFPNQERQHGDNHPAG